MPSVVPIILSALLITGTLGALWSLGSARTGASSAGDASSVPDLRIHALTRLAWALFLLLHSVLLLLLSESREVAAALSIGASAGGALAFLAALIALLSCISLERKIASLR